MVLQKLHIIITLIAALVMTIVSLYKGDGLYAYTVKVVITAVVFFVIGSVIKMVLDGAVRQEEDIAQQLPNDDTVRKVIGDPEEDEDAADKKAE